MFDAYSGGDIYQLRLDEFESGTTGIIGKIISEGQKNGEFDKQWNANLLAVSLATSWLTFPQIEGKANFPDNPYAVLLEFVLQGLRR